MTHTRGEGMSKFTKTIIMQTFLKLLNERSFDKITVKDIVEECGINRNTFYYNFKDIYDLVDEILQKEINEIVEKNKSFNLWSECLLYATNFAIENKKAIYHLHNSEKKQQLDRYLERVLYDVIAGFVEKKSEGKNVKKDDIEFVAKFYCYALLGLLDKWLDNGMKEDIYEIIEKTGVMLDSNIEKALDSLTE